MNKAMVYLMFLLVLHPQMAFAGDLAVINGQYVLAGKAGYRAVGVNYFDAINRSINRPGDRSAQLGLSTLARFEIPFVRVMFGGYWPNELKLYQNNPKRYFQILDEFVEAAEQNHIGIVASLAWNYGAIPDLVGEPASAWGQPESKTIQFFRRYVTDVVSRYRKSPSIWMWEFGNEMALYVDLPNSDQWRRPIDVSKGTLSKRGPADDLKSTDQALALAEFVRMVRKFDSKTLLSTGNSLPRPYAYNNSKFGTWRADTEEQFCEMLERDNPRGYDSLSIHIYASATQARNYDSILKPLRNCSIRLGKPIFAGEIGASEKDDFGLTEGVKSNFTKLLDAVLRNDVDLSAVWVFDFSYQEGVYNITTSNSRAYQLDLIQKVNRHLRANNLQLNSVQKRQ